MGDLSVIEQLRGEIAALESTGSKTAAKKVEERREAEGGGDGAFKKIIALVNASDRSERAIRDRLAKAEFEEQEIEEAIDRAKRCGFIDDMRFADVLIRSRLSQGKGCAGIERELVENDIAPDEVPGWPFDYGVDEESERQRALVLLDARPTRSKNKREGAYRKLVQKGYSASVAASAARIWSEA